MLSAEEKILELGRIVENQNTDTVSRDPSPKNRHFFKTGTMPELAKLSGSPRWAIPVSFFVCLLQFPFVFYTLLFRITDNNNNRHFTTGREMFQLLLASFVFNEWC